MSKVQTRKVEKHFNWGAVTLCILWKNPSVIHLKKALLTFCPTAMLSMQKV